MGGICSSLPSQCKEKNLSVVTTNGKYDKDEVDLAAMKLTSVEMPQTQQEWNDLKDNFIQQQKKLLNQITSLKEAVKTNGAAPSSPTRLMQRKGSISWSLDIEGKESDLDSIPHVSYPDDSLAGSEAGSFLETNIIINSNNKATRKSMMRKRGSVNADGTPDIDSEIRRQRRMSLTATSNKNSEKSTYMSAEEAVATIARENSNGTLMLDTKKKVEFNPEDPPQSLTNVQFNDAMKAVKESIDRDEAVLSLPRGGTYVKTSVGPIQFGIPPETIKDCLALKLPLPQFYVIPKERFNRRRGINVAEFEFPTYFNFFVMRQKVNLITDSEEEKLIRAVLQETLFGPENPNEYLDAEFQTDEGIACRPDLEKELGYFRNNPFKPDEKMQIDTLLQFTHFDKGIATLVKGENVVDIVVASNDEYSIVDNGKELAVVSDIVVLPPEIQLPKAIVYDFQVPAFGCTFLGTSHGFDPSGTTTGFVLWVNGRGIMVDPPPNSSSLLQAEGIPARLIDTIILTHCHADHDAGTFQKILDESRITVITTPTIMNSFLRKYSALSGLNILLLRRLFVFQPVQVDDTIKLHGSVISFFYTLHAIPCMAFQIKFMGKSLVYSADTCYIPDRIQGMQKDGFLSKQRANGLINFPWDSSVILHEAGVPPIHTPPEILASLPEDVKERLYCVHVSKRGNQGKPFPFNSGLKIAACGVENTIRIEVPKPENDDIIKLMDLVSSLDLFRDFPLSKARNVLHAFRRVEFSVGDVIMKEGDEGLNFFILESGMAEMYSKIQRHSKMFGPGEYFGEMALMTSRHRSATITAITTCKCLMFDKPDFLSIVRNTEVYQRMMRISIMRMEASWQVLSNNSFLTRLSEGQRTELLCIMRSEHFNMGDTLWNKGDSIKYCLIIKSGTLAFKEQKLTVPFKQGAFVGEVNSMMESDALRHAAHETTLIAKEDTEVYAIERPDFVQFLLQNPGIMLVFLNAIFLE